MIVRIRKEKNTFSQKSQSYLELIAETIKEEKILQKIHFKFDLFTHLYSECYLNPRKRKSKKVSLRIPESHQPA